MKVICDSCHAKYSLSDDKLTKGKTFKIKCKKCGHVILVKPVEESPEDESTRVVDYSAMSGAQASAGEADNKIWHVAVGDKTDGPFALQEVLDKIAAGQIPPDALAWNEGLPNWEKISSLPDFASSFDSASPQQAPVAEEPVAPARVEREPVFSSEPAPAREEPEPARSGGGGFFGVEEESSEPATSLKGQRHENSVLFSLDNLQNLAASQTKKPSPRPGYINPASQGSGLVDIQEMAAAMKPGPSASKDAVPFDLPAAPVVATPISIAPVLIPTHMESERPKWIVPTIIGVVVVVVVAIMGFVFLQMSKKEESPKKDEVAVKDSDKTAEKDPQKSMDPEKPGDMDEKPGDMKEPDGTQVAATNNMTPDEAMTPENGMGPGETPPDDSMTPPGMTPTTTMDPGMTPTTTMDPGPMTPMDMPVPMDMGGTPDKPADGDCTKVWCMLKNNAPSCCAKFREGSSSDMGGSGSSDPCANNPNDTLGQGEIRDVMSGLRNQVQGCFSRFGVSGQVTVRVTVNCSGNVTGASASGEHASSPLGGCITKVVRGAKFPRFKSPASRTFQYPFVGG